MTDRVKIVIRIVAIPIVVCWTLFPIVYTAVMSIAGPGPLPTKLALPSTLTTENWWVIFTERPIWPHLYNSIYVGLVVTVISVILALPSAYSISRCRTMATNGVFFVFLIFRMIPWVSLTIPLYFFLGGIGLLNTAQGLIISHLIYTIPLCIWIMKGFFDMTPPEIEEAALTDGASRFGAFFRISLPLVAPGVAVTALFGFLFSYIELMYAAMITRKENWTIPIYLASFVVEHQTWWRLLSCAALFSTIPAIVLFIFLQKYFVRGLTFGAVKG